MKLVNAIWEKRNLGIDCNEITIETTDVTNEVLEKINNYETQYTVVKVPSNMNEICNGLQQKGYTYIETVINCFNAAKLPDLNSVQKRIVNSLTYI